MNMCKVEPCCSINEREDIKAYIPYVEAYKLESDELKCNWLSTFIFWATEHSTLIIIKEG